MTWNVCRSPLQGLGSWLAANASSRGLLSALLRRCHSYSQLVVPASVTGVQKLKPCGTAVAGKLLPREKPPDECVPRRVSTYRAGLAAGFAGATSVIATSSNQARKVVLEPAGRSYPTRILVTVRPAATAPIRDRTSFHCWVESFFAAPCAAGLTTVPCWSFAVSCDR